MSVQNVLFRSFQVVRGASEPLGSTLGVCLALAVLSYGYSAWVLGVAESVGVTILASPAQSIAVALLGLCLFPRARARLSQQSQQPGCRTVSAGTKAATCSSQACSSSKAEPHRLSQPPFSADLSSAISSSDGLAQRSSKPRRRRLPRLSIELTPLPRLSLDFQRGRSSSARSSSKLSSSSAIAGCSLYDCPGAPPAHRWAPGMARIASGEDLAMSTAAAGSSSADAQELSAAGEATASLGFSPLPAGLEHLEETISEAHLLQVGAMLGERSCRAALQATEAAGPLGHPGSFYGSADTDAALGPWELLMAEAAPRVRYWAWRRPLRRGLCMYMTRSVFDGASPAELRAFMNDDAFRVVWDGSMSLLRRIAPAGGAAGSAPAAGAAAALAEHETAIMQALVAFPKPMASRSYVYGRRVWPRPADGGCYCLCRAAAPPGSVPPPLPGRSVAVGDYASGCVIRAPHASLLPAGGAGRDNARAAEVLMVYFEDSGVRPGLANLGIKKGLWPLVLRTEKALRVHQAGAAANVDLAAPAEPQELQQRRSSESGSGSGIIGGGGSVLCKHGSLQLPAAAVAAGVSVRRSASVPSTPLAGLSGDIMFDDEEDGADSSGGSSSAGSFAAAAPAAAAPGSPAMQHAAVAAERAGACSQAPAVTSSACSSCSTPELQLHPPAKPHTGKAASSSSSSAGGKQQWGWWSGLTRALAGALRSSGEAFASASVALWQSHTRVALMLPSLEWRLLRWLLTRLAPKGPTLLGYRPSAAAAAAAAACADSGSTSRLSRLSSHPIGDWAHPGLVGKLQAASASTGCSLLHVPCHPLAAGELQGESSPPPPPGGCGACCCCAAGRQLAQQLAATAGSAKRAACGGCSGGASEPAAWGVHCDWPAAAYAAQLHMRRMCDECWERCSASSGVASSSCCHHTTDAAGSEASCCSTAGASASASASAAGCCCGSRSGCSSGRGSLTGGCSGSCCGSRRRSGSGSRVVRDPTGGRRQRRVVVRLMQAAGVRLAHKLLSAMEQQGSCGAAR